MLDVFFFKQKTAYEMRISDWSSDVCSSDLARGGVGPDVGFDAAHDPRRQLRGDLVGLPVGDQPLEEGDGLRPRGVAVAGGAGGQLVELIAQDGALRLLVVVSRSEEHTSESSH